MVVKNEHNYESFYTEMSDYVKDWSENQKSFEKKKNKKQELEESSFFGLRAYDSDEDASKQDYGQWMRISKKLNNRLDEELLTEDIPTERVVKTHDVDDEDDSVGEEKIEKHGMKKDLAKGPGPDVKFHVNPVHFASVGTDQELRVQGGEKFMELAKMKSLLYSLESELLRADTLGEDTSKIERTLKQMRKECHKMCQLLTPDAKTDII
jgi:hypothetical protein